MEQYKIEYDYIMFDYLNGIQYLSCLNKLNNESLQKCDILINNKLYVLYKYDSGNNLFIPKNIDLNYDNIGNIYNLKITNGKCICFSIIRKKNGIIETNYFTFNSENLLYNDSLYELLVLHKEIYDKNNDLNKMFNKNKETINNFFLKSNFKCLKLVKNELLIIIRKNKNSIVEKSVYDTIMTNFEDYVKCNTNFEQIDHVNKDKSFIYLAECIIKEQEKIKKLERK